MSYNYRLLKNNYKLVAGKNCKPGDKVEGYSKDFSKKYFSGTVIKTTPFITTVLVFGEYEEEFDATGYFEIPLTEEEIKKKYYKRAMTACIALNNEISLNEIRKEQDNSFLTYNPYELAGVLSDKKYKLLGVNHNIAQRKSFLGTDLDVGVAVEDNNGYQWWVHGSSEYIQMIPYIYPEFAEIFGLKPEDVDWRK